MKKIITIAVKEIRNLLQSPLGYIFAGLLMLVSGWLFWNDFFVIGQADLGGLWSTLAFLFSLFIPAISMNLIAEEKRTGSWEVLLSLPVDETQMVLGKFGGSLIYMLGVILLTIPGIITIGLLGKPEWGLVGGGFLGTFLLAAAYLATGLFGSSLSNQPVIGFLVATVILLLDNFIGQEFLLSRIPTFLADKISFLSLNWHSSNFSSGLISASDFAFYLSWIVFFLILTVMTLKTRDK